MIFEPSTKSSDLRPGIIYIHGGGWVLMEPGKWDCQLSIMLGLITNDFIWKLHLCESLL